MQKETSRNKTAIVFGDLHLPDHDPKALSVLLKVMRDNKWNYVVNIGDFMDFGCISHHNKSALRAVEGKRVQADFQLANKILDDIQAACGKVDEHVYLEGNHEEWVEKWIDANPILEGVFEVETQLKLEERGIDFIRRSEPRNLYTIGNARFIHGNYTNDAHAKKHALHYGTNIFYGHLHDVQSYSLTVHGDDKEIVAQCIGCLCDKNLSYKKGRPDKWNHAFMTMTFLPNGNFHYQINRIFNGTTVYNGKIYTA